MRFFCILFFSFLVVCCTAQDSVTINVVYKPDRTYHFVEVEERIDAGETKGLEVFGPDEVPFALIWTTKTTINKVIHTGAVNSDLSFPITIDHHRTREYEGSGVYKEGVYQDSVIVRGSYSEDSLIFDSIQLLPRNDYWTRDASKAKVLETLFAYNHAASYFDIKDRTLRPGESFVNTIQRTSGKEEGQMDSMVFTLLRIDQNIAVLSFTNLFTFDYKTSNIDKHSELHIIGEIKVDLEKQLIIQRNQVERFFELEKYPALKTEVKSFITKVITETLVE